MINLDYHKSKKWRLSLFLVQSDLIILEDLFQLNYIVTHKLLELGQQDLEIRKLEETMLQLSRHKEKVPKPMAVIKFFGYFTTMSQKLELWTYLYSGKMKMEKTNLSLHHLMELFYRESPEKLSFKWQESLGNLRL